MTQVKICGITNLPDAISAVLLGADYVGFLVDVKVSKDKITVEEAKEIITKLPLEVKPVYVTLEKKPKKIISSPRFSPQPRKVKKNVHVRCRCLAWRC